MKHLNLSEWALNHRSMVAYLILVFVIGGALSYQKLGRAEDPDFTFKVMVVRTLWPGATAAEVEQQIRGEGATYPILLKHRFRLCGAHEPAGFVKLVAIR